MDLKFMYVLVIFDLPTLSKKDIKRYTKFRNSLLKDGFTMFQYSCYLRICKSAYSAKAHIDFVTKKIPKNGEVRILKLTNNIYNSMEIIKKGNKDKGTNEEKLMTQTVIEF